MRRTNPFIRAARTSSLVAWSLFFAISVDLFAQRPQSHRKHIFLKERGCPLVAVHDGGSVLVLRNRSSQLITNWSEFCIHKKENDFSVLQYFQFDPGFHGDRSVAPSGFTADEWGIDATPLNLCRAQGGRMAIAEVVLADGSRWRSRWNRTGPLPALTPSKSLPDNPERKVP
jgi:hypothetical protein